jgi:tRNA dimethylallyltransferase
MTARLAIVGPTAAGKSETALAVAELIGAEIVSADSMLVYRGMDIGTAKPSPADRARVRHHLIDVAEPSEAFSVARYQELAFAAVADIERRGRVPLVVGGSGLYVRSVLDGLEFPGTDAATRALLEAEAAAIGPEALYRRLDAFDPDAAARIDPANARRTVRALEVAAVTGRRFSSYATAWEEYPIDGVRIVGLEPAPGLLKARIEQRVRAMMAAGFLDEVRGLVDAGFGAWLTARQAIGYAEMARHLAGELTREEAVAGTIKRTRALARRQMAWFRRDPRIRWLPAERVTPREIAEQLGG